MSNSKPASLFCMKVENNLFFVNAEVATKIRDMSIECDMAHKTMKEMSPSVAPLLIFLIDEGNSVTLPSFWLVRVLLRAHKCGNYDTLTIIKMQMNFSFSA